MNTLVEQGIMPEYKTSPSLHEQRTKLERAKMGDMLRAKIASRPGRAELVHRHILEVGFFSFAIAKILKTIIFLGCPL